MTKKDLIGNLLLREIMAIRIDALGRMLEFRKRGILPGIYDEGASGEFDNKGALFVPGGLVLEDSDRRPVRKTPYTGEHANDFRKLVRNCMQNDNATLLFNDGIAASINLDNGFFAEISSQIIAMKNAVGRQRRTMERNPPRRVISDHICKSLSPESVPEPYGARTKISSCLAVCLAEPRLYYIRCRDEFALRGMAARRAWELIRQARRPVVLNHGSVLAPPYVVVCHQTRYREQTLGGLTRILGIGQFGEFATITFEVATTDLLEELREKHIAFGESEVFAMCDDRPVLGVIRIYPRTSPGARSRGVHLMLISPQRDLGLDVNKILRAAQKRYTLE